MTPERDREIMRICDAAMEHEGTSRAAFLADACGGDVDLRQQVESLLVRESDERGFLEAVRLAGAVTNTTSFIGRQLGPYTIHSRLGAGAMGEVYRARDTKLARDVAIKILPPAFTNDTDRLARFEREARTLASLNHPHIGAIYGFEAADGVPALVLELVEGETLAERLSATRSRKTGLPVAEAISIAKQIAQALDASHEKGIVHRDLKPANIKITRDGRVKVLDFGLAKAAAVGGLDKQMTKSSAETREGLILGTPAYMSPEQARGQAVDKRTDIWALGCVLYEMLTGLPPFKGGTVSDTIAAVLEHAVDWDALPHGLPVPVARLLRQCLERDPTRRLRDIGDALLALDEQTEPVKIPPTRTLTQWKAITGILAAIAVASLAGWLLSTPPVNHQSMRLPVDLGPDAANPNTGASTILSPDGTRVVYRARNTNGRIQLFTRALDQEQAAALPGTENAISPFFSPNGQYVAFFDPVNRKLKKIAIQQGNPIELCSFEDSRGGTWDDDGNIIAAIQARGPLYRIPSSGGTPQPITELKRAVTHRWPQAIPGMHALLFNSNDFIGDFDRATIELQSLKTGQRKTLVTGGSYPRYSATGHLLYIRNGTLYAVPLDVQRQELTGREVPVADGVMFRLASGGGGFDISGNGTLVYAQGSPFKYKLKWLDRAGNLELFPARMSQYGFTFRFSPDGNRLAFSTAETGNQDVWLNEWKHDGWSRLTSKPDMDGYPVWSPDGRHVAYTAGSPSGVTISWKRTDGLEDSVQLTSGSNIKNPYSFSPKGDYLAFQELTPETKSDLLYLPIGDVQSDHPTIGKPITFLQTTFDERAPMISPDGEWIAYQSDESGQPQIYVQSFPEKGRKWPISSRGGSEPLWSKRKQEIFYRGPEGMMVASYAVHGNTFEPGIPKVLISKRDLGQWFEISPDEKRFLILDESDPISEPAPHITFFVNFFDVLRRLTGSNSK